jgi:hypothetical protein
MDTLTDHELGVLERSNEGSGVPARCFAVTRTKRGLPAAMEKGGSPSASVTGSNAQAGAPPDGSPGRASPGRASPAHGTTAFVIEQKPASPAPTPSRDRENFVGSSDYAPAPVREEGRMYVRLFMSAACVAEVMPGPILVRTSDVLPVPMGAKSISVKSPCGGLAEVYWGREEKPRVSEPFGKNQALTLQLMQAG